MTKITSLFLLTFLCAETFATSNLCKYLRDKVSSGEIFRGKYVDDVAEAEEILFAGLVKSAKKFLKIKYPNINGKTPYTDLIISKEKPDQTLYSYSKRQ